MQNPFRPLGNQILVELIVEPEQKSDGGIILAGAEGSKKNRHGVALDVGPGVMLQSGEIVPLDVEAGDHVMFSNYAGTEVTVPGRSGQLYVIEEKDVLLFAKVFENRQVVEINCNEVTLGPVDDTQNTEIQVMQGEPPRVVGAIALGERAGILPDMSHVNIVVESRA